MRKYYISLVILFFFAWQFMAGAQTKQLVINEIMSSNTRIITDEDGAFEDWIELYNNSDEIIRLEGYFLSDDLSNPQKWQFPAVSIAAKSYLLIWASDKNRSEPGIHTNFKIGKEGEALILSNASGLTLDQTEAVALADNQALARIPDGSEHWQVVTTATPGVSNIAAEKYTGVAVVRINTEVTAIIDKETKVEATMEVLNSSSSYFPAAGLYNGKIGISTRGYTSSNMPKKSYSIEIWNDNKESIEAPLLDMPAGEDWALIANYSDKSLMRNYIAYELSRSLGRYAPRAQFVDVYLNDSYQGNYLLVERIRRGDERVNVKKLTDAANHQTEPNISGGYILEVTPTDRVTEINSFTTSQLGQAGKSIIFTYPKDKNVTAAQVNWISSYINEFESVLYSDDFADPVTGYSAYIDTESFIDYIIVNELAKNMDAAMHASVYLYKDRTGKLNLGPVWDFDIGFGNINFHHNWRTEWWHIIESVWLARLIEDKNFANRYVAKMEEVRPLIKALPARIDETAAMLQESAAKNFERWDILGQYVWPNYPPYPETYQGEVDRLKEWVTARTEWVYANLESLQQMDYPTPFKLACQEYTFTDWTATSEAGTYPAHMVLQQTKQPDPELRTEMDAAWSLSYNLNSRSRINGLGERGISFVNTGNAQDNPAAGYVGAALLSLNTMGMSQVAVSWTGGTMSPNNRHYGLRMQYRVGTSGSFTDVLDTEGNPVEYVRNATAGHSQQFENVLLPVDAGNQPMVQVRWKYYYIPTAATGNRAELRLDDISVKGTALINTLASAAICDGEPAILSVNALNNATIQWIRNGIAIEGATSNTLEAGIAGEYTVSISNNAACSYTTKPFTLQMAEAPAKPTILVTEDNMLTITPVLPNVSYVWRKNGEVLNKTSAIIAHAGSGTYSVQAMNASCVSETSDVYVLSITSLPALAQQDAVVIYPNPSNGELNILTQYPVSNATVTVIDLTGKEIYKQTLSQLNGTHTIDLTKKPKGIYLVKVIADKQHLTKKVTLY